MINIPGLNEIYSYNEPIDDFNDIAKDLNAIHSINQEVLPNNGANISCNDLRKICLPFDLTNVFLSSVEESTNRNMEACGILAGYLVNIRLEINFCFDWFYFKIILLKLRNKRIKAH